MKTAALAAAALLVLATSALAQESAAPRVSSEAVASATMFTSFKHVSGMLDVTNTVRLGGDAQLIVRPWFWLRPDGTSTFQWYQLQVRYSTRTRTPLRVDAGVITSPLGLYPQQMRADLNPTIAAVPYYVIPLPRFEPTFDGLQPLTAGYPVGVVVSTSGTRWDLRGGVTDSTPARPGVALKDEDPYPSLAQGIIGGGVTLRPGLRIGGGFAHGRYRKATTTAAAGLSTVANVEAEYTVNHTRLSGEWVIDRFHGTTGTVEARSFYVQGVQTLTPRLFAAARIAHIRTPPVVGRGVTTDWKTAEFTGGVRATEHVTVRAGYLGQRAYFGVWSNAASVSLVLDGRWWR
jgi:hypothetical protein